MSAPWEKPAGHLARRVDHDKSQRRPNGRAFRPPDSETALRQARTSRDFSIINPRKIGKGGMIGTFDIEMPWGLKLTGAMLLEMGGRRWVTFPSFAEFVSPAARERFRTDVLSVAEEALK
jgi:hypothetical protein